MTNENVLQLIHEQRRCIDAIDEKVVVLLNKRAAASLAIRDLKPGAQLGLYDAKREGEIFEHIAECNEGPLFDDDLRAIYEVILRISKEMPA